LAWIIKIGWNPDSFGYNWQLPQIYKKSGIDYFVSQNWLGRPSPEESTAAQRYRDRGTGFRYDQRWILGAVWPVAQSQRAA